MPTNPVEIISHEADLSDPSDWLPDDLVYSSDPLFIVAITGPQASGKSTFANALFNTSFPVANRGSIATATTRGILLSYVSSESSRPHTVVLDVEGADARSRGKEAKTFAARCASFVSALADVVVVNMWYHDACRLDSAAYSLLRSVLLTCAQGLVDGSDAHTALVVAVRDAEDDSSDATDELKQMIISDINDIWADVALEATLPVGAGGTDLADVVDLHVVMFPHIRHQAKNFDSQIKLIQKELYDGTIATQKDSKQLPPDGFSAYAQTIWESVAVGTAESAFGADDDVYADRKADNYYGGQDFAIVAAFRCDEVFSTKLADASGDIGELLDIVEAGTVIDDLGQRCDEIVTRTLEEYDVETSDYADEPVYERKRTELEAILDTGLISVYMKNISIISREALTSFKSAITEDIPHDLALYNADSVFVKKAREGIRQGSSWTYETERVDLRNMMTEIAQQQRKLATTQVNASQQQSTAIQFLRMQHLQMQAVQQQALGGSVGQWNLGAAYRPPDSNVNLSLAYQQGRTNLQVSMVPDESATLLGPTGFTAGVGPGNLGLSFNVNF